MIESKLRITYYFQYLRVSNFFYSATIVENGTFYQILFLHCMKISLFLKMITYKLIRDLRIAFFINLIRYRLVLKKVSTLYNLRETSVSKIFESKHFQPSVANKYPVRHRLSRKSQEFSTFFNNMLCSSLISWGK